MRFELHHFGRQGSHSSLHLEGVISDAVYEKEVQRAAALLDSPGGGQWWNAGARTHYTEGFVTALEGAKRGLFRAYHFQPGRGFYPAVGTEIEGDTDAGIDLETGQAGSTGNHT